MIVAFEGIDGAGKTLASRLLQERLAARGLRVHLLERDGVAFGDRFTDQRLAALRGIIWPHEPEPEADPLDASFYLFLLAAWFAALRSYAATVLAPHHDVVIVDRSYFRVVAKAHLRIGSDIAWLLSLFAGALQPDLVILLDIDPALAWQRRSEFRATEIGRWDGFGDDAAQAFCGYQGKVRATLRAMAEERGWPVETQTEALSPSALADRIERAVLGAGITGARACLGATKTCLGATKK